MAGATEASSTLQDVFAKEAEQMMKLKFSQLKKIAKKNGIDDDAIQRVIVAGADEEDTKRVIIGLIFKSACVKAAPTPARTRVEPPPEEDSNAQTCTKCKGCIRPPNHEGPCMDGLLNDLVPESECVKMAAGELERHQVLKQELERKIEEALRLKAASEEEVRRKVAREFRRQAEAEARKRAEEEEACRKAAEEAQREAEARQRFEEEEARRQFAEMQRMMARKVAEEEEAQRKAAEEARRQVEEEEARKKAAEEEEARKKAEEGSLGWTRQSIGKWLGLSCSRRAASSAEEARRAAEARRAEEEEMDQRCVDTFLECVKSRPWRERIRTPLKGTMLYTKHMRPARPAGTSVDVKDSSFHCLSNFLKFLEEEGLLCLKPGLTDPVVTDIRYNACANYKYVPRPKSLAPEEAQACTGTPFSAPKLMWQ